MASEQEKEIQETGEKLFAQGYRLGCEDKKSDGDRPIHPSCINPSGECGCGKG
jgi:hypothetical protein